jgi:hypothetical protein
MRRASVRPVPDDLPDLSVRGGGALPVSGRAVELLAQLLCRVAERQQAADSSPAPGAPAPAPVRAEREGGRR